MANCTDSNPNSEKWYFDNSMCIKNGLIEKGESTLKTSDLHETYIQIFGILMRLRSFWALKRFQATIYKNSRFFTRMVTDACNFFSSFYKSQPYPIIVTKISGRGWFKLKLKILVPFLVEEKMAQLQSGVFCHFVE